MHFTGLAASAAVVFASLANGQILINELSFGHSGRISSSDSPNQVPNYDLDGQPYRPQVLSNKIVLTPVGIGNVRASLWAQKSLTPQTWTADFDFRATGAERGGGNLNVWLAKDGGKQVGMNSIYTVGKFDGLALVIDSHGGSAGMIRGFLNDGSKDFKSHHNVDELAFGNCIYSYRNRGSPSQIKMRQSADNFRVEVDGQLCFESSKFSLPTGYNLGVTAATPDNNPDSFEVFKLAALQESNYGGTRQSRYSQPNDKTGQQNYMGNNAQKVRDLPNTGDDAFDNAIPDEDPGIYTSSEAQFQDVHRRLQSTNHQLAAIYRSIYQYNTARDERDNEFSKLLADIKSDLGRSNGGQGGQGGQGGGQPSQREEELYQRIKDLEKEVRAMRNDLGKKIQAGEKTVKGYLTDHHASLSEAVIKSSPGHAMLITVIVGSQVLLLGAYVVYMRRRTEMPKKYL